MHNLIVCHGRGRFQTGVKPEDISDLRAHPDVTLWLDVLKPIVKVLTVSSIVLMAIALVAGMYGMNFEYMPELHWRFGYLWALGLMAGIAAALILVCRRLRWL